MNLRITSLFFALLLTMLWVFGLMVAHKKAAGDQSLIFPKLGDVKIDKVRVAQFEKGDKPREAEFETVGDKWFLKDGKQKVRVDGFRIENIIKAIKEAKHDDTADVSKEPSHYGLDKPKIAVTLFGKQGDEEKTWEFFVGNESAGTTYVNTGEKKDRVFAVSKRNMDNLAFKDPNYFRAKKIFDFVELSVNEIDIKPTAKDLEGKELALKRGDNARWNFVKPAWGLADFGSEPEDDKKKKDPFKDKEFTPPPITGGIKGLLGNIISLRVDDEEQFVPLGKGTPAEYGVEPGKEATMRIDITSTEGDKKVTETMLVGKEVMVDKVKHYYVRINPLDDDGVMKVSEKWLKPIIDAVADPGKLRSRDVAAFDKKDVDVVTIKQVKDEFQFFKQDKAEMPNPHMPMMAPQARWDMVHDKKKQKGSDAAINALLTAVLGKKAIVGFNDGTEAELKAKEADWGLASPQAEIAIYLNAVDTAKKDEKKTDKKDDKKEEATADPLPAIKKDHKPEMVLAIGKFDKDKDIDIVHIRRELKDGTKTYFTMKKEFAETALPPEGVELAYLDLSVPDFAVTDVTAFRLQRTTDKGTEVLELEPRGAEGKTFWYVKDKNEPSGYRLADNRSANTILGMLGRLQVKKWLKKIEDAELDKYGLRNPVVTAKIQVKKNQVAARSITVKGKDKPVDCSPAAGLVGLSMSPFSMDLVTASFVIGARELDEGETVEIHFGKETDVEKDKPGTFATHSGSKLLFLAEPGMVKAILKEDVRDLSAVLNTQRDLEALFKSGVASNPTNALMLASPFFSGTIHQLDPEKIKRVNLTVRTPQELRSFQFDRIAKKEEPKTKEVEKGKDKDAKDKDKDKDAKDKDKDKDKDAKDKDKDAKDKEKDKVSKWTWEDKSGLKEFQLDPDKAAQLVKEFAKLRTDRFVSIAGGKRTEYKLDLDKAAVKVDLLLDDDKTVTVVIGTNYLHHGYFATSTQWPGVIFFVPMSLVEPILRGPEHFAKERIGVD